MNYKDFGGFTFQLLKMYERGEFDSFNNPEKEFIEILKRQLEELKKNN